jgi:hypothetical protein
MNSFLSLSNYARRYHYQYHYCCASNASASTVCLVSKRRSLSLLFVVKMRKCVDAMQGAKGKMQKVKTRGKKRQPMLRDVQYTTAAVIPAGLTGGGSRRSGAAADRTRTLRRPLRRRRRCSRQDSSDWPPPPLWPATIPMGGACPARAHRRGCRPLAACRGRPRSLSP